MRERRKWSRRFMFAAQLILVISCQVKAEDGDRYVTPEPVSIVKDSIRFTIDPRVELISVIQAISSYPGVFGFLMCRENFQYPADVHRTFDSLKTHPAVLMFERWAFRPAKMNFGGPSALVLYLDDSLNIGRDISCDAFVLSRIGGRDSLDAFARLLRDFARQSSFNSFYRNHAGYYGRIVRNTMEQIDSSDYIGRLEGFYGVKQHSYNFVLVSLYGSLGYGHFVTRSDGRNDLYDIMGAQSVVNGLPSETRISWFR